MIKKEPMLYFDYAAATPMDPIVEKIMLPYLADKFYNPSATYLPALAVRKDLETARSKVALIIGARSNEIVFTAGGTDANNLAVHGVLRQYLGSNIIVSAIEHESVLQPAGAYNYKEAPVNNAGIVSVDRLAGIVDDNTVLVSVAYANNEVGTIQPIRRIAGVLRAIRQSRQNAGNTLPLYLHTDASQAAAYLDLHVSRLGVDLMTLNGGKIYGPKQSGALYVNNKVHLEPYIMGGGQEHGYRSGTENIAGAIGFATALQLVQGRRLEESARLRRLQGLFLGLLKAKLPAAIVNGSLKERLPDNVNITFPGQDNERLLLELENHGILCASGSACNAGDKEPSHVLRALGSDEGSARSSLRFSMGQQTKEDDVRRAMIALVTLIAG